VTLGADERAKLTLISKMAMKVWRTGDWPVDAVDHGARSLMQASKPRGDTNSRSRLPVTLGTDGRTPHSVPHAGVETVAVPRTALLPAAPEATLDLQGDRRTPHTAPQHLSGIFRADAGPVSFI
jgi:hypothetical protein